MKIDLFDLPQNKIYVKLESSFIKTVIDRIKGEDLKKFYKNIGFYHTEKAEKLNKIIKFPSRNMYANGETEELILKLLNNKPHTSFELCKTLNRKQPTINHFLLKLKNSSKVKVLKYNNQTLWKVI